MCIICDIQTGLAKEISSLVKLDISNCSKITYIQSLPENLKYLNCSNCVNLKSLPDLPESLIILKINNCLFDTIPYLPEKLKILHCSDCINLKTFSQYINRTESYTLYKIGGMSLEYLDCSGCINLWFLPNYTHLKILLCEGCSSLEDIPPLLLRNLIYLNCSNSGIKDLNGIHNRPDPKYQYNRGKKMVNNLRYLNCSNCNITSLDLPLTLSDLNISDCKLLKAFPDLPPYLQYLNCSGCQFENTDDNFRKMGEAGWSIRMFIDQGEP